MKKSFAFVAFAGLVSCAVADPVVSDVSVAPRREPLGVVDVSYRLSGAAKPVDVAFSAFAGGEELDVPQVALTGEFLGVENGTHVITLDMNRTACSNRTGLAAFRVALEPVAAKTYMILDLRDDSVAYSDEVIGANGAWDDLYKTHCIVLRRCPAGSFTMGSPVGEQSRKGNAPDFYKTNFNEYMGTREKQRLVKISQPFYLGVFEFTQRQLQHLHDDVRANILPYTWCTNNTDYAMRPVDGINYNAIRGSTLGSHYPADDETDATSVLGRLRARFGIRVDLPTEAQWEYACRAGTTTAYHNGADTFNDGAKLIGCVNRAKVEQGARNVEAATGGTAFVGAYLANNWGIYDMSGNVFEWTRDWASFIVRYDYAEDPVVPEEERYNNQARSLRGGYYANTHGEEPRSASRGQNTPGQSLANMHVVGFRLYAPVARSMASSSSPADSTPTVSDVKVVSRWPWSAKVDLHYFLSGVTDVVDIRVTAQTAGGETLTVKACDLEGDWLAVGNGAHRLTWDLSRTDYVARRKLEGVTFTLVPEMARTYMLCDLVNKTISYTNEVIGAEGAWSDTYKTDYLVLRRCPAGRFICGSPTNETYRQSTPNGNGANTRELQHEVKVSKPFYIGVFEFTQGQCENLVGRKKRLSWSTFTNEACFATRPLDTISWNSARGGSYPASDAITEGSLIDSIRKAFDIPFDLPTDAQWEFAYRAGTTTPFYNGGELGASQASYNELAREIAVFGRTRWDNKNNEDTSGNSGTLPVGSKLPNAWGLYDMAGNVWEWARDYAKLSGDVEPYEVDPAPTLAQAWNGGARSVRGGGYTDSNSANHRAASRGQNSPSSAESRNGLRLYAPISY